MRTLHRGISALASLALGASTLVGITLATASPAAALPNCPAVMAHGGYTDGPNNTSVVRQPNFTAAIDSLAPAGVKAFEVDAQLTKMSTSNSGWAFMWHNSTDNGLDGTWQNKYVGNLTWTELKDRHPARGPWTGAWLNTLNDYLTQADGKVELLIEIKSDGEMVNQLFSSDSTIRANSRNKIIGPIKAARDRGQVVRVHAGGNTKIQEFINSTPVLSEIQGYPAKWINEFEHGLRNGEEPNDAARTAWQTALDEGHATIATDFPKQFIQWLNGKCGGGGGGGNYKFINVGSGKCLDVAGSGVADGTQVQIYDCNGSGAQQWAKQDRGGNNFSVINANSAKCLDVDTSSQDPGAKVQIWVCNGSAAQGWYFEGLQDWPNHFVLRANHSNQCLDVAASGTANGTKVQQYTCNYTAAQQWEQVPA